MSDCRARSPADGDQTSIHAFPALQSAASVTAVFSSVLFSQTSSQECVLHRATSIIVRTMRRRWILSLSWKPHYRRLSMLDQREGTLIQSSNIQASSGSNHQHHKASTHVAGRSVSTSAIVADRRSTEGIELRPLLSVNTVERSLRFRRT